ncbi:hypothetical protein AQJ91_43595 [Streptomyces dysideae]|uniref:IclR-ED domain-containing protein n=1 Tax=Streptomyces dysideae TaxID=909626 RepID=A0A101UQL2_9ACTN|nr:hypothetical protein AQJ91_43595 [Streptomyces dysideae]
MDQELEQGLVSIGVPIRNEARRVVAGINLSTHVSRRTPDSIRHDLLPPLLDTAADIEAELKVPG